MKRLLLLLCVLFCGIAAMTATDNQAAIKFGDKTFDFGTIKAADGKIEHEFKFTNTGTAPLVIKAAYGSCACTVPEYPVEPIMPGASSAIKVIYDPVTKAGEVSATVTVVSNDKKHKRSKLLIKGTVIPLR